MAVFETGASIDDKYDVRMESQFNHPAQRYGLHIGGNPPQKLRDSLGVVWPPTEAEEVLPTCAGGECEKALLHKYNFGGQSE